MAKYKLIKLYPGTFRNIGDIADDSEHYNIACFPEFWKPVKESFDKSELIEIFLKNNIKLVTNRDQYFTLSNDLLSDLGLTIKDFKTI